MECHKLCERVPPLERGELYKIEGEGDQHGATRRLACAEGAGRVSGSEDSTILCRDGNWTKAELECLTRAAVASIKPNGGVYFPDEGAEISIETTPPDARVYYRLEAEGTTWSPTDVLNETTG